MAKTIKSQVLDYVEQHPHITLREVKRYIWEGIHKYPAKDFNQPSNKGWYSSCSYFFFPSKNDPRYLKNTSKNPHKYDLVVETYYAE